MALSKQLQLALLDFRDTLPEDKMRAIVQADISALTDAEDSGVAAFEDAAHGLLMELYGLKERHDVPATQAGGDFIATEKDPAE